MRSLHLRNKRTSNKNGHQNTDKIANRQPVSKETQAREILIGMQQQETLQSNLDWAKDARLVSSNWLSNMELKAVNRGFSPSVNHIKTTQNHKKINRKTPQLQVDDAELNLLRTSKVQKSTELQDKNNSLKTSVFGCLVQQIIASREKQYDISTELFIPAKVSRTFRLKHHNILKFSRSSRVPKPQKTHSTNPENEFSQLQPQKVFLSTRYNQFPKRRTPTKRHFSPSKTSTKFEYSNEQIDPLAVSIQKLRKLNSQKKVRLNVQSISPSKKKCSEVVVQGYKIL